MAFLCHRRPGLRALVLAAAICLLAVAPVRADPAPDHQTLVLSDRDAGLYAKIFAARRQGDKTRAEALARSVSDRDLLDWVRVHKGTPAPLWLSSQPGGHVRVYNSPLPRDRQTRAAASDLALSVSVLLKTDDPARALGVVERALSIGTIDRVEGAQLESRIAAAYLYKADPRTALRLAHLSLQIGGSVVPEAAWIAGLSSWVLGDYVRAAQYFAWVPNSAYAGPWLRSAGAYWTARALMREGRYQDVSGWLEVAARHPHSFYGLIATRALGVRFDFDWTVPPFSAAHLDVLKRYPGAVRALKLAQAGQMDMARIELALLDEDAAPVWREALAALAVTALKPASAMKVADILQTPQGGALDMALYPVAPWQPTDGYRLDPALIHAFVRQESAFKPGAQNKTSGATGLLQLLPRTARAVDSGVKRTALSDPETSMALGQKYLETLLGRTNGNLFETAIAYNAGSGNLAQWQRRFAGFGQDPLLFIELIPFRETRGYVERVMANYWIYSLRMGAGAGGGVASLDEVAAGHSARYAAYAKPRPANVYASLDAPAR